MNEPNEKNEGGNNDTPEEKRGFTEGVVDGFIEGVTNPFRWDWEECSAAAQAIVPVVQVVGEAVDKASLSVSC